MGGPQSSAYLEHGHWQLSFNYRRLTADRWFVGREVREDLAPFGQPLYLDIQSFDVTITRGITDRLTLQLTTPFSRGTHSRFYADGERHVVEAKGLGDVSVIASLWMGQPKTHPRANLALSVGLKAPTGRNSASADYYLAGGNETEFPVDQSIQLGDGGWGVILETHGFRELFRNTTGYVSASYLLSPTRLSHTALGPGSPVRLAVPDVYSARAGMALEVPRAHSLAASVGLRVDGIPLRDLVADDPAGFRRPAKIAYIEPGVTISHGPNSFSFSTPIRAYLRFPPSLIDTQLGRAGGGDLSKYLVFAGYTRQF